MIGPRISAPYPPATQELTPISGGTQNSTSTSLADVTGSDMAMDVGWYDFSFGTTHSAALAATSALFSLNGNSGLVAGHLQASSMMATALGDRSTHTIFAFNQGPFLTSSAGTGNNRCQLFGTIKVTTAGILVLRFASETGGSAITITGLIGWWRKR